MNTKDFLRNDAIDGKAKVCNKQLDYLALRLSEMPICRRYLFFSSSSSPSSSLFFFNSNDKFSWKVSLCWANPIFRRSTSRRKSFELFGSWKCIIRPRAAEREWIRVSRINSSGERIVRSRHARFIDALAAWNRNCVRLRVMLECDEIKSDISRARMWVIPFRFDNELFWKFFFLPFSFQSFKHLIESFDAIISFGNFNKSDFILWYIIFL